MANEVVLSGEVVVAHAKVPDQPADFVAFYTSHFPKLVRYAWRLTGDQDAARDIAQEALTRTFTRWVGVRNKEGYAYLVTTNLVRDRWQRARRETDAFRLLGTTPEAVPPRDLAVRDAVERLPRRLRDIVVLHYFADLSVEQIATVLRRPKGTVKQRLFAARRALAETLGDGSA